MATTASSKLDELIGLSNKDADGSVSELLALAETIKYNLEFQQDWTNLKIHSNIASSKTGAPNSMHSRPLISGLPPRRLYVHPDDQTEELMSKKMASESKKVVEAEWILPTHIREKWSISRLASIFDSIEEHPPHPSIPTSELKARRGGKRLILAALCDDSTVTYYIVHDGIVKPRQN